MQITVTRIAWLLVSVALAFGSFAGGDVAVVCGWVFLIWTLPFGVIWWFFVYDYFQPLAQSETIQIVREPLFVQVAGVVIVIAITYLFWFTAVPAMVRKFNSRRRREPKAL
jgi:hypothetical protein